MPYSRRHRVVAAVGAFGNMDERLQAAKTESRSSFGSAMASSCHCKVKLLPAWRTCRTRRQRKCRGMGTRAASDAPFGMVLEADTVVCDMHDAVHRPAFNRAFESLGLSCANWSSRIYYDIRCDT